MRKIAREGVTLTFFTGVAATTLGVALIYLPAGFIFGGMATSACAALLAVGGIGRPRS